MVRALHASGPSRTARPWPPPHRARCSLSVSAFERDIGNAPPGASKGQAMKSALWQAVSMLQESNKQVGLGLRGQHLQRGLGRQVRLQAHLAGTSVSWFARLWVGSTPTKQGRQGR